MMNIKRQQDGWVLTARQEIPAHLDEVFEFFSDAANLERLTPPWLNFEIVTPDAVEMKTGALIDYKLRLRMIPIKWRTEIRDWNPPHSFVDVQLKGPYKKWIHTHTFSEKDGHTLCEDHVAYDVPLGFIAHPLIVKSDLKKIFAYRQEQIAKIFPVSSDSGGEG